MRALLSDWALRNGCTGGPVETFRNNAAHCDSWEGCPEGAETVLCTIDEMGHCWPGAVCPLVVGAVNLHDLNGNDAIWDFFSRHRLP
jgi:poly(3-hydroxybutyrate) depolymerase